MLLGAVGLFAVLGWIDYALLPALAFTVPAGAEVVVFFDALTIPSTIVASETYPFGLAGCAKFSGSDLTGSTL